MTRSVHVEPPLADRRNLIVVSNEPAVDDNEPVAKTAEALSKTCPLSVVIEAVRKISVQVLGLIVTLVPVPN